MCQTLCMHGREDINMNMRVSKMNTDRGKKSYSAMA